MFLYKQPVIVIARDKLTGLGEHWGVLLPNGMVAHNTQERGPHLVTLAEFAAGKKIKEVRRLNSPDSQLVQQRITQAFLHRRSYHPTLYNCEVFANEVTGHSPISPQVNVWLGLTAFIIFLVVKS